MDEANSSDVCSIEMIDLSEINYIRSCFFHRHLVNKTLLHHMHYGMKPVKSIPL